MKVDVKIINIKNKIKKKGCKNVITHIIRYYILLVATISSFVGKKWMLIKIGAPNGNCNPPFKFWVKLMSILRTLINKLF